MQMKRFPSSPDLQTLRLYERKGVESIREFINQLLKDPDNIQNVVDNDNSGFDVKDASLIFTYGSFGIPLRVLTYLETQTVDQLTSNGYTNWDAEVEGGHTNTIRLNMRNPRDTSLYFRCAITPSDGIFLLEYRTNGMKNSRIVKPKPLTRSFTF